MKALLGQQFARLYYDHIYRLHGLAKAIISFRETKFTSDFWSTMQKLFVAGGCTDGGVDGKFDGGDVFRPIRTIPIDVVAESL